MSDQQTGATDLADPAEVEKRIRAAYEAFHRRDVEGILAFFDPEVVWVHPDGMRDVGLGGPKHGHAGMREFLAHVPTRLGGMRLEPQEFLVFGRRVIVLGTREVKALDGRTATLKFVHSWTLENGKAVLFEDYFDTVEMRRLIDLPTAEAREETR
ncbi:ketosteroid isomerase-like protein [Streptacidiphilus sp. BW17]|uniref:nuclear transport factor 2 family protein n=1 Tax=Streptacidiphilus sp. BW17 TaxID=3156274 RepID=UPI0035163059